jgi:hypothetical protein
MGIDPVVAKAARIAELRRATFNADRRGDADETSRLGDLWRRAADDERATLPTSPDDASEKLRQAAYYATIDTDPAAQRLARELVRAARGIDRRGPGMLHPGLIEVLIAMGRAIPGGQYTGIITEVVPRLEAALRWMTLPGLIPPPTVERLTRGAPPARGGSRNGRRPTAWRPWLSIVPATAAPAGRSVTDSRRTAERPLRLVNTASA